MRGMTPLRELLPPPKEVTPHPTGPSLPRDRVARIAGPGGAARERLERGLRAAGLAFEVSERDADIELALAEEHRPQAYRLTIDADRARVEAGDEAGLFYGACTLVQLLEDAARRPGACVLLPGATIRDWPDFERRGVMLDVSRDRVPRMEELLRLVDRLAGWKLNELQLYFEHTFAYPGHELVWRDASPFTAGEIRELDAFCRARHIELVPNQNSFGHFHRWLMHDRYRPLAECPAGVDHPFSLASLASLAREPFSLCPVDPRVPELLGELYDGLLPCFSSRSLNVGLDETFDLGQGRSAAACAERGRETVYLDFVRTVHRLVSERGHRMQFWGDVIIEHPERVPELPQDAVALEWGYEADHPFEQHGRAFAGSGLTFYVCPGTSSWQSLSGRLSNARANLAGAARAGMSCGARGYLVTDWGDFGHWQPPPVSLPGFVLGALHAWDARADAPETPHLSGLLDARVFPDAPGMSAWLLALADVYRDAGCTPANGSALFFLLRYARAPFPHPRLPGLTAESLRGVCDRLEELAGMRPEPAQATSAEARLVGEELDWVRRMLAFAARFGVLRAELPGGAPVASAPAASRAALACELEGEIERMRGLWLRRSRSGGLADSTARLRSVADLLTPVP